MFYTSYILNAICVYTYIYIYIVDVMHLSIYTYAHYMAYYVYDSALYTIIHLFKSTPNGLSRHTEYGMLVLQHLDLLHQYFMVVFNLLEQHQLPPVTNK